MTFYRWNDSLATNISRIDREHQNLVRIINRLYEAMYAGEGQKYLEECLDNLIEYTQTHFATEERLMKATGYPDFTAHQTVHRKMAEKVVSLKRNFNDQALHSPVQISNFLKNWLNKHILGTDMKMAVYLKGKGIK